MAKNLFLVLLATIMGELRKNFGHCNLTELSFSIGIKVVSDDLHKVINT